eukprot:3993363-Prymnesium_polylepis.1
MELALKMPRFARVHAHADHARRCREHHLQGSFLQLKRQLRAARVVEALVVAQHVWGGRAVGRARRQRLRRLGPLWRGAVEGRKGCARG